MEVDDINMQQSDRRGSSLDQRRDGVGSGTWPRAVLSNRKAPFDWESGEGGVSSSIGSVSVAAVGTARDLGRHKQLGPQHLFG